jgi:fructokinase
MILVCGEALVDLVPASCGGESGYLARAGGSPYNVAVGLGRLGVPVGFFGRVSDDPFGQMLRDRLVASNVATTFLRTGPEPTTLAVVHLEPGEEPQFAFYGEGTADRTLLPADLPPTFPDSVAALHFGSISLVREPAASTFEMCMRREHDLGRVISLDPNVRPSLVGDGDAYRRRLSVWLSTADIVKVSRADLAWLYPGQAPEDVARLWLGLGPALVVVSKGRDGAAAYGASSTASAAAIPVEVADTVGGGDAFTSGLLARLSELNLLDRRTLANLTGPILADCLEQANRVAALTCRRTGAEPPTRSELESLRLS